MEASGIYFPAQQMIDSVQVKRNKSDVPQSINQINQFRKNETRRIACYTGTDYDIELHPTQLSFLSDLPKTSISGKKDRSFDLDTLHFLLNEKVGEKELNIVTWVLGRSPPTSEQKKFRALMSQHLWHEKHPSVLLIILAAEQRYDVTNTDKDMLSKIADPFADFLNWYNDSLQPPETKKDDESESGDASKNIAFHIASTLGILPVKDVHAKVAVLHYVTWAEIMARSYQLDDIERQRLKMRRDQEDQQNMGKAEHDADSNLNPLSDSQLPTVMSLKEILMSIFSVEVAEKILGQRVEDWLPGESEDMLNDGKSQRFDGSNISQRDVEVMSGTSHVENEIRSATDQSSVGKINAQVLAHMKQYIRVNDNPSEDGHSVTSHAKIDRDKSPHFVAKKDLIKEIKSFHELNKIKDRFDTEMQALMKRQLDDQLATFLLAFDYNDEEYQEYEGKLRPIY
jgi:hypothetical protein